MIYYPMRSNILKIEIVQRKDSIRSQCADAAKWLWENEAWPTNRMYRMYSAEGIIAAANIAKSSES